MPRLSRSWQFFVWKTIRSIGFRLLLSDTLLLNQSEINYTYPIPIELEVKNMIEQEIGRRIKEIRKQKKIPQEKLAEMIGISPNYMSALERGAYNIKLDLLVQIIDCLDITADDLFRDVIKNGYVNRTSRLADEIESLPTDEQQRIFEVLDALLRTARRK